MRSGCLHHLPNLRQTSYHARCTRQCVSAVQACSCQACASAVQACAGICDGPVLVLGPDSCSSCRVVILLMVCASAWFALWRAGALPQVEWPARLAAEKSRQRAIPSCAAPSHTEFGYLCCSLVMFLLFILEASTQTRKAENGSRHPNNLTNSPNPRSMCNRTNRPLLEDSMGFCLSPAGQSHITKCCCSHSLSLSM